MIWGFEFMVHGLDLTGRVVWYLVLVQKAAGDAVNVKRVVFVYVKLHPTPESRFLGRQPLPSNLHDSGTAVSDFGAENCWSASETICTSHPGDHAPPNDLQLSGKSFHA